MLDISVIDRWISTHNSPKIADEIYAVLSRICTKRTVFSRSAMSDDVVYVMHKAHYWIPMNKKDFYGQESQKH